MKISSPPPPPAPVSAGDSIRSYLESVTDPKLQQLQMDAEKTFGPQYTDLNLQSLSQYLLGSENATGALDLFGQASEASGGFQNKANTAQRLSDIQNVEQLGPRATAAFQAANPQLMGQLQHAQNLAGPSGTSFDAMAQAIQNGRGFGDLSYGNVGQGALGGNLYDQAMNANGLGAVGQALSGRAGQLAKSTGQMTQEELRNSAQTIREGYQARGTLDGSGSVSAEALGRLTNERQNQANDLSLAAMLNQGSQAELGANRAFQQGVYGQELERGFQNAQNAYGAAGDNRQFAAGQQQQNIGNLGLLGQMQAGALGQDRGYALQLAQMQAGLASDPFQAILGRSSGALQYGAGQQAFAQGGANNQGPQLFDPNAGINLGLQNASNLGNYQAATYGAKAGAQGAMWGGLFQGLGSVVGGKLAGGCWVAREVYGNDNPKWIDFRYWLFNRGPKWFMQLYCKYGERFAAFISQKPALKNIIRFWMDSRIATLKD